MKRNKETTKKVKIVTTKKLLEKNGFLNGHDYHHTVKNKDCHKVSSIFPFKCPIVKKKYTMQHSQRKKFSW